MSVDVALCVTFVALDIYFCCPFEAFKNDGSSLLFFVRRAFFEKGGKCLKQFQKMNGKKVKKKTQPTHKVKHVVVGGSEGPNTHTHTPLFFLLSFASPFPPSLPVLSSSCCIFHVFALCALPFGAWLSCLSFPSVLV